MKWSVARRWSERLGVVAVVALLLVPLVVAFQVWSVARQDARPRSDAIIVLGASQFDGRPSAAFAYRLAHAAELYRQDVAPTIVTVGGSLPGDRFTEAGSGKRWLAAEKGVPPARIIAVREGTDTWQSIRAVAEIFRQHDWKSAVIVTDPWHTLRSRTMANDAGIDAATSPTRSGPMVQSRMTEIRYIARETAAYLYYLTFRRPLGAEPRPR